jgi:hypothetical protein
MMILSRAWYVALAAIAALAVSLMFVAVDEYNRQSESVQRDRLVSDGQVVESTLKVDAYRRLEALLPGSIDPTLKQALVNANASKGMKVSLQSTLETRRALTAITESIPADVRSDALFAVDHDGRVLAEVGVDSRAASEEFELGGYPAVNDALRGWARADVWMLGSKMYYVVARPADYEPGQAPAGALVGLKEVTQRLADDVARRTRTNVVFYGSAGVIAGGVGVDGLEPEELKRAASELKNVVDGPYEKRRRSDVRTLSNRLAAVYVGAAGDASVGGGLAVVRSRSLIESPIGLLADANRKQWTSVPWLSLAVAALLAVLVGILLSQLEQNAPLRELLGQSRRLRSGSLDRLQLAPLRGPSRRLAQDVNDGIERLTARADVARSAPSSTTTQRLPALVSERVEAPKSEAPKLPSVAPLDSAARASNADLPSEDNLPTILVTSDFATVSAAGKERQYSPDSMTQLHAEPQQTLDGSGAEDDATVIRKAPAELLSQAKGTGDGPETTAIAPTPERLLAVAAGDGRAPSDEAADWTALYESFLRAKKECGQPSHGVTFAMFSDMLTKKRNAIVGSHQCKDVQFSIAVTDGKVVMRAVPMRA